jgi:type II secretion system protein G
MNRSRPRSSNRNGFSLIELVVVILIMTILAGVIVPQVIDRKSAARDARRLADVRTVRDAIEQFYLDNGSFPAPTKNGRFGGWDVSHDGDCIPSLVEEGYLRQPVNDPVGDDTYHYKYYVYAKNSYGCQGPGDYYVLGVTKFESEKTSADNQGYFKCSGRDWSSNFAYVTGGGASFK